MNSTALQKKRRLNLGMALAASAGMVFGYAWTADNAGWWWAASLTMLCGVLVVLSGRYLREHSARDRMARPLGELLMAQGLITEQQLGQAMARSHQQKRPLGQILVDMKLVTPVQVARALCEQVGGREAVIAGSAAAEPNIPSV